MKFCASKSDPGCSRDLGKRFVIEQETSKIVCIFNHRHEVWTEEDERRLETVVAALNSLEPVPDQG